MPSLIVLHIFKDSGILGLMDSVGIAIALLPIYFLGRYTRPRHRILIILLGAAVLLVGALFIAISFKSTPAIIFMLCAKIVFTLLYMPYLAIRMRSIDISNVIDKREQYAYFIDIEAFLGLGRLFGMSIFLFFYFYASQVYALRFGFMVIVLFTFFSAWVAKRIKQE
jgi:YQGE family putative transporter